MSHCSKTGHFGEEGTESIVRENFEWFSMRKKVHDFVQGFIHCIISCSEKNIPRPLIHALHGLFPEDVVRTDYLYMGDSVEGKNYVLVTRDDLLSYVWLWPMQAATSECAVDALKI